MSRNNLRGQAALTVANWRARIATSWASVRLRTTAFLGRTNAGVVILAASALIVATLVRVARWSWYQIVETWREIKRSARPPVRVRRRGNLLVVTPRADLGGDNVLMVPLNGSRGIVGLARSTGVSPQDPSPFGIEFWNERSDGEKEVWRVAASADKAEMDQAFEILSKALSGRSGYRWLTVPAYAVGTVFVVSLLLGARPDGETSKAGNAVAATSTNGQPAAASAVAAPRAGLMQDAFGSIAQLGGGAAAAAAASISPAGEPSLADRIYDEAKAASDRSKYEFGPPQGPAFDPVMGEFGLGTAPAGCDPALAFTVSE